MLMVVNREFKKKFKSIFKVKIVDFFGKGLLDAEFDFFLNYFYSSAKIMENSSKAFKIKIVNI